ncbi:hypothetical protein H072_1860 [Dactylellina haptotyla CBS 200.50]|uniref:Geranylgeranyl transferase type-2 subunit alpha n=1 Tax=Dactylellina haptotyla (strain CBS 200.50) TaxID=1284197 RepID=S8AMM8_DACHA|nr:hypothetical protein H072_1860 [Dactylellina haptotyla CBS 200.50]
MSSHGIARSSTTVRSGKAREADLLKIKEYNTLVAEVQDLKSSNEYTKETLTKTSTLLSQNPEFNTIWNYRRRIILHLLSLLPLEDEKLSLITSELRYLLPLLQSYPKCYWIWNYRIFLLQTASAQLSHASGLKVWKAEMSLVDKMLGRDSRNFHGWGYRRYVVNNIEGLVSQAQKGNDNAKGEPPAAAAAEVNTSGTGSKVVKEEGESSMVESEFAYTSEMYKKSLSNFSAWHNRSKLISRLLAERGASKEERETFLDGELGIMQEALFTDPYDQSLQLYNHWLISATCSPRQSVPESEIVDLVPSEKMEILVRTMEWMKELLEEEPECRLLLEELIFIGGLMRGLVAEGGLDANDEVVVEMKIWLEKLMQVDPMRMGRWKEMAEKL